MVMLAKLSSLVKICHRETSGSIGTERSMCSNEVESHRFAKEPAGERG